jgi:imidazole glycerol phosphate synthase glutamine amidotransferase subunit
VEVAIVRTGVANVASVETALRALRVVPRSVTNASELADARAVVLPGVGSFGAASRELLRAGLWDALREFIAAERPTLAICLGMQLLADASEEYPGAQGLGLVQGTVSRFPDSVRVPQLGWNRIEAGEDCVLLESGHACFANSYRLAVAPPGWAAAWSDHGGPFVAALERGPVLACQFHPELSGAFGRALLARWLERC